MSKKETTKKICSKCNESKNIKNDFYLAAHDEISSDGRLVICKSCLSSLVDMSEPKSLINTMRMIDRPFIRATYEHSLNYSNQFGEYMRMLATPQNRHKTYENSEFLKDDINNQQRRDEAKYLDGYELEQDGFTEDGLRSLQKKWGKYEISDYEFLEEFYQNYIGSFESSSPTQRNLYINIAKTHLQADKELSNGNIKGFKDLMDLSSKLHNDGNIKPVQTTGADDDRGVSTYGLWIKEIEKEEPCEYFESRPMYEDADSLKKYFEKWFIRSYRNTMENQRDFNVPEEDEIDDNGDYDG